MRHVTATELEEDYFDVIGLEETFERNIAPEDYVLRQMYEGVLEIHNAYSVLCDALREAVHAKANQEMHEGNPQP